MYSSVKTTGDLQDMYDKPSAFFISIIKTANKRRVEAGLAPVSFDDTSETRGPTAKRRVYILTPEKMAALYEFRNGDTFECVYRDHPEWRPDNWKEIDERRAKKQKYNRKTDLEENVISKREVALSDRERAKHGLSTFVEAAKALGFETPYYLREWLREQHLLLRSGGRWHILPPYDKDQFLVRVVVLVGEGNSITPIYSDLWTEYGIKTLRELIKEHPPKEGHVTNRVTKTKRK